MVLLPPSHHRQPVSLFGISMLSSLQASLFFPFKLELPIYSFHIIDNLCKNMDHSPFLALNKKRPFRCNSYLTANCRFPLRTISYTRILHTYVYSLSLSQFAWLSHSYIPPIVFFFTLTFLPSSLIRNSIWVVIPFASVKV